MAIKLLRDTACEGKIVVIRQDLNVPMKDGVITNDKRIRAALPGVRMALEKGAAGVVLLSHLGRPVEGEFDAKFSLAPVAAHLSGLLGREVRLAASPEEAKPASGEIVLLENVRFFKGEKKNDPELAARLAALGDVYVMDAFGAAHRAHASTEGAVRLAALMDLPVTYVWTHDSIGVGEDGPTHQPIEHLASYRAIPNLAVVRPADAAETAASWKAILEQSHPAALILSRQNLPNPARGEGTGLATTEDLARGAYVLADTEGTPDVILLASGSEVSVALEARETLAAEGVAARVVSVPCLDWFEAQDREYRDSVLPPSVRARVSVEAGIALPWYRWIGDAGRAVSIEHFGASAPGDLLFKEYGIDAENVVAAAKESIEAARS